MTFAKHHNHARVASGRVGLPNMARRRYSRALLSPPLVDRSRHSLTAAWSGARCVRSRVLRLAFSQPLQTCDGALDALRCTSQRRTSLPLTSYHPSPQSQNLNSQEMSSRSYQNDAVWLTLGGSVENMLRTQRPRRLTPPATINIGRVGAEIVWGQSVPLHNEGVSSFRFVHMLVN